MNFDPVSAKLDHMWIVFFCFTSVMCPNAFRSKWHRCIKYWDWRVLNGAIHSESFYPRWDLLEIWRRCLRIIAVECKTSILIDQRNTWKLQSTKGKILQWYRIIEAVASSSDPSLANAGQSTGPFQHYCRLDTLYGSSGEADRQLDADPPDGGSLTLSITSRKCRGMHGAVVLVELPFQSALPSRSHVASRMALYLPTQKQDDNHRNYYN